MALEGAIAQRDLTRLEGREFDAVIAARIQDAVAKADFASAGLPDFAGVALGAQQVGRRLGHLFGHVSREEN